MRRTIHGFTLIELLVVISIIALLIALLLPALGKAKETSQQIECGTRMRQLLIAVTVYAQDNQGWITPMQMARPGGIEQSWRSLIWPYIQGEANMVDCPTEQKERYALGDREVIGKIDARETYIASGIGAVYVHYNAGRAFQPPLGRGPEYGAGNNNLSKFEDIQIPGGTVFFGDGNSNARGAFPEDLFWIYKDVGTITSSGFSRLVQRDPGHDRHSGRANYAFGDGHVTIYASNELECTPDRCVWSAKADPHDERAGGRGGRGGP